MPGTGHTAGLTGCGRRLIKAFIDAGAVQNLDTSCADKQTRPPYFVTPAGPDPSAGTIRRSPPEHPKGPPSPKAPARQANQ
jgi:hypothetical protein